MAWHLVQWGKTVEIIEPPEPKEMPERVRHGEADILP
jgi:hypothetical protein